MPIYKVADTSMMIKNQLRKKKKTGGYNKRMKSIKEESGAYISQLTAMIDETNAFVDGQFLKYKLCNLIRNKNAHKTKLEIVITHQFYT